MRLQIRDQRVDDICQGEYQLLDVERMKSALSVSLKNPYSTLESRYPIERPCQVQAFNTACKGVIPINSTNGK